MSSKPNVSRRYLLQERIDFLLHRAFACEYWIQQVICNVGAPNPSTNMLRSRLFKFFEVHRDLYIDLKSGFVWSSHICLSAQFWQSLVALEKSPRTLWIWKLSLKDLILHTIAPLDFLFKGEREMHSSYFQQSTAPEFNVKKTWEILKICTWINMDSHQIENSKLACGHPDNAGS